MYFRAEPRLPSRAEFQLSPIWGVLLYLCLHPLTQNDQIRHGNTYEEGRVFRRSATPLRLRKAGLFKGQFTTAQVGEDEALKAPRGVGCGEGMSPPHRGRGLCPLSRKKCLILTLNMVSFDAFWMVFFTVQLPLLHAKTV